MTVSRLLAGHNGTACDACPDNANCAGDVDPPRPWYGWYMEPDKPFIAFNW
jgi:hypothetical protein